MLLVTGFQFRPWIVFRIRTSGEGEVRRLPDISLSVFEMNVKKTKKKNEKRDKGNGITGKGVCLAGLWISLSFGFPLLLRVYELL